MQLSKNFHSSEFDSPDLPGSGAAVKMLLVLLLERMRALVGAPIQILSGYRTHEYNATLQNSVTNSAHTKGLAADIFVPAGQMLRWLKVARKVGFTRIGIGTNSLHLDIDASKSDAIWHYPSVSRSEYEYLVANSLPGEVLAKPTVRKSLFYRFTIILLYAGIFSGLIYMLYETFIKKD